jgi:hypothetical protein
MGSREKPMSVERKSPLAWLNSPFSLLLSGFLLTTLAGSYINNAFHAESWKSKARFEIFKERLQEASDTQTTIIVMANMRIILLNEIYSELGRNRLESAREKWKKYFENVKAWNTNVKSNNNRISLLFGDEVALTFLDNDENHSEEPGSLHHIFRKAHNAVLDIIECMKDGCDAAEKKKLVGEARRRLDLLGLAHDDFAMQLRLSLREKEALLLE